MTHTRNLLALVAASLVATASMAMQPAEYSAAKDRITADYKVNKQKCDALKANAKDICMKEAKGHEKVAKAELEAEYKPSDSTQYKARVAKADADYDVAKERCDDQTGNAKDVCKKDAKAAHVSAVENAKVAKAQAQPANTAAEKGAAVSAARKDAAAEKREADYKAAKERCDAMSGDAKSKCVDDAKRMYAQ
ncbi:hypothetical protein B2J86_15895 [Acidovorax sp. SRB_14]|uniref:hypothetical protein n=1 Tax=unclassified Acidovorax TaxID=2684926 RepID=UPI00145D4728|nr:MULTISPECIES: hypothetical protein [unclassified Acidovorax]NMM77894.1 hypothetical protein [Acidovorax sp. SRB_24]NMM82394.1 hypothetical protein [Acidovorax sp. SRB_14]NMM92286.1 hypothetical protein [Rhodococcus sp. SRB_17]